MFECGLYSKFSYEENHLECGVDCVQKENQTKGTYSNENMTNYIHTNPPVSKDHNTLNDFSKAKQELDEKDCIHGAQIIGIIHKNDAF